MTHFLFFYKKNGKSKFLTEADLEEKFNRERENHKKFISFVTFFMSLMPCFGGCCNKDSYLIKFKILAYLKEWKALNTEAINEKEHKDITRMISKTHKYIFSKLSPVKQYVKREENEEDIEDNQDNGIDLEDIIHDNLVKDSNGLIK